VGHDDDARGLAGAAVETGLVTDCRARLLSPCPRHIFCGGAGSEPARDEQEYLAGAPWLAQQSGRDASRLSRPGWRYQQRARAAAKRANETREDRIDRKARQCATLFRERRHP